MPSFGEEAYSLLLSSAVMHPLGFPILLLLILVLLVNTKHLRKPASCEQHTASSLGEMGNSPKHRYVQLILAENPSAWHPQLL